MRTGSLLASVAVEYYIEPNGDARFYGGTSVIYFLPGEAVRQVTVIAKDDRIPQVITNNILFLSFLTEYYKYIAEFGYCHDMSYVCLSVVCDVNVL